MNGRNMELENNMSKYTRNILYFNYFFRLETDTSSRAQEVKGWKKDGRMITINWIYPDTLKGTCGHEPPRGAQRLQLSKNNLTPYTFDGNRITYYCLFSR